jgi:UDP-N-acetylmuramyl pentapeptide synthase
VTLAELVEPLETVARSGGLGIAVTGLTDDSRAVRPGHVFVAVKGGKADGHRYLAQAVQAGAVALVVQDPAPGAAVPVIQVPDSRRAVGLLA